MNNEVKPRGAYHTLNGLVILFLSQEQVLEDQTILLLELKLLMIWGQKKLM